jgi:hypothetical protein
MARAVETKHKRNEKACRRSLECGQEFASIFKLTRTGCRIFWWTEANILCSNRGDLCVSQGRVFFIDLVFYVDIMVLLLLLLSM